MAPTGTWGYSSGVPLLISNLSLAHREADPAEAVRALLGAPPLSVVAVKISLDARQRRKVWRATCKVEVADEAAVLARGLPGVRAWTERDERRYGQADFDPVPVTWFPRQRVIVVGAGPAGLFASLALAESGVRVLLVERGAPVEERVPRVASFWRRETELDPESNLIFGEGGAGTFSDGKLYTRRRDGELGWISRRLVDLGAPPSLLTEAHPHLGTDALRQVLPRLRARLQDLGAQVRFHARVDGLLVEQGACRGVRLAQGEELEAEAVIMAPGHSARDTVRMLVAHGCRAQARTVAVGVRIEHPQDLVDRARYGRPRGKLPPASYRLTHKPRAGGPGAHSFCMCPGGVVVPAVNHPGRLVVNGMSYADRGGRWANAALVVPVSPQQRGSDDPLEGYRWQERLEAQAYQAGGGDWTAPAQRVVDLLSGRDTLELPGSSYPLGLRPADLRALLPPVVLEALLPALAHFESKLPGFCAPEALLIAPESRTTSPVRVLREADRQATGLPGLYPVGEGTGWGGGITSCAVDGARSAAALVAAAIGT